MPNKENEKLTNSYEGGNSRKINDEVRRILETAANALNSGNPDGGMNFRKFNNKGENIMLNKKEEELKLIKFCEDGNFKEVQASLESLPIEINVNAQDDKGLTPLMCASANGHLDIVEYLIREIGANPNIKNNEGKTALDLVEENRHEEVAEFLRKAGAKHGNEID